MLKNPGMLMELKIQYWYKDIDKVLLLFLSDIIKGSDKHSLNAMERISNVVFSCDHGKGGQSHTAIKMLVMDADRDDSHVLKEGVSSIGNINHTKDGYPIRVGRSFFHRQY